MHCRLRSLGVTVAFAHVHLCVILQCETDFRAVLCAPWKRKERRHWLQHSGTYAAQPTGGGMGCSSALLASFLLGSGSQTPATMTF